MGQIIQITKQQYQLYRNRFVSLNSLQLSVAERKDNTTKKQTVRRYNIYLHPVSSIGVLCKASLNTATDMYLSISHGKQI